MSEEFEVRGAHEAVVEDGAERREPLAQRIALFSAMLATIGAVVSLLGGHTQEDALYFKNEAVLLKAQASDLWSYYQAEEIKRRLVEATAPLAKGGDAAARAATYAGRARALQARAEALDRRSEEANAESARAMRPHVKLAVSMTFLQIGIALASITALTRRRWLFVGAGLAALTGSLLALVAWL